MQAFAGNPMYEPLAMKDTFPKQNGSEPSFMLTSYLMEIF
jgi:hypothetical protein